MWERTSDSSSLLGSHLTGPQGRVLSFEPMPETYRRLLANVSRHAPAGNVTVHNLAIFDEERALTFRDFGVEHSAYNSAFGARTQPGTATYARDVTVNSMRLDSVLAHAGIEHVDLVKIDAESSELQVLRGMSGTIERFRPAIVLEVGDFSVPGGGDVERARGSPHIMRLSRI